jgi:ABC-type bacteriocin/lantibiotic exporter with double-glycine peptidase domain
MCRDRASLEMLRIQAHVSVCHRDYNTVDLSADLFHHKRQSNVCLSDLSIVRIAGQLRYCDVNVVSGSFGRRLMRSGGDFVWLLSRLAPLKWRIASGLSCVTVASLVVTIDPLLMRTLIDQALPRHDLRWASALVSGIGLCYLARSALASAGALINFSISQKCVRELRIALLDQMNELSPDYHEQMPTGEKLTRFEHDVDEIASLGTDTANQSIRAALFLMLNLAIMAKLSVAMTLTILPLLPLFAIIQRRFRTALKSKADKTRAKVGWASSLLNEHLSAVPQIQFLGAEKVAAQRTIAVWDDMLRAQWVQRRTELGLGLSVGAILVAAIVLVLGYGSAKVLGGSLTIGGLVAFYAYVTRVFEPVSSAMDLYARLQTVGASIRRVREVLSLEPTVSDRGRKELDAKELKLGFSLSDVRFSYGTKTILDQFNVRIGAGEHVALIGTSGSGKSTLARLLIRAADPDSGDIRLEANPLHDYTLASLRRTVCYVPQHPILFDGTVRTNLLYANPKATNDELDIAIEAAQLTSLLSRLPQGLDTPIGFQGTRLSGGERQRLALARSLLSGAAVSILDEATSALDAPTEHQVLSAIAGIRANHTMILISHRISSLAWVDRFVLLAAGKIVGTGTHDALYTQCALYRSLYDASAEDGAIYREEISD